MSKNYLEEVYRTSGNAGMRKLYDAWADEYDQDVVGSGYQTPGRVAAALNAHVPDKATPILDFGCGTGLSGEAFAEAGFTHVDGADLSPEMLAVAQKKHVYNKIWKTDPEAPLDIRPGTYPVVAAVGVISVGAAPASVYDDLVGILSPGGLLAFSVNDLSMKTPDYIDRVRGSVSDGTVDIVMEEYGPHLSEHGENSGATVFIVERQG